MTLVEHDTKKTVGPEEWLERARTLSGVLDVLVIDSVAALEKQAYIIKNMNGPDRLGGISALISDVLRNRRGKKATTFWVNKMRSVLRNPSADRQLLQIAPGGRPLAFFSSTRLELTEDQDIVAAKDTPPIGKKVRAYCQKNKIAPLIDKRS